MGNIVNKRELAAVFGISERTLTEYQKAGLPMEYNADRGASNHYDTEKVHAWLLEQAMRKIMRESPKDRLDRVKADEIELRLAERLEQVAPADQFERAWADHIAAARIELLTMPDIVVSEIHALHGIAVDRDLIAAHVEAALAKLTSYDIDDDDPEQPCADGEDALDGEEDD